MNGPAPAPVLVATDLFFSYPDRHVLTGVSVGFGPGLTWLEGANGSGKSTLLRLLGGALDPLRGQRSVMGIDAARQPLDYRRQVFWCGPGAIALGHLRPAEYFGFLQGLYPRWDEAAAAGHVQGFGLAAQMDTLLQDLSTGTQRKVWLAAALAVGTAAVLLDEPLNALDAASLAHARQALARCHAQARQAWVVASHAPPCDGAEALPVLRLP